MIPEPSPKNIIKTTNMTRTPKNIPVIKSTDNDQDKQIMTTETEAIETTKVIEMTDKKEDKVEIAITKMRKDLFINKLQSMSKRS